MPAKRPTALVPEPDPERLSAAQALAARAAEPARWRNVRVATAGWADRSLIASGAFYPATARTPEARLRHYASQFTLVEVDATYYTLLTAELVARWVSWTPEHFHFDVKAHPVLTGHPIDAARLPADLKAAWQSAGLEARAYPKDLPAEILRELEARFWASLEPLTTAGRLGAVLAQLPPWFAATRGNARELETLAERCAGRPVSIEFRHKSWTFPERVPRVLDHLQKLGFSYVCVDEPPSKVGGVAPIVAVTAPRLAIVRFHGQNLAGWEKRGASVMERFNYLYTPRELGAWVERVKQLSKEADSVHAVFNNCVRNYAVLNAKDLAVLLDESSD
jgi:uncharacterized protein YecE (DUF72 family)